MTTLLFNSFAFPFLYSLIKIHTSGLTPCCSFHCIQQTCAWPTLLEKSATWNPSCPVFRTLGGKGSQKGSLHVQEPKKVLKMVLKTHLEPFREPLKVPPVGQQKNGYIFSKSVGVIETEIGAALCAMFGAGRTLTLTLTSNGRSHNCRRNFMKI